MTWVDLLILGLIGLSMTISLFRGFVKEAFSLATWIIGIWVALVFADELAALVEPWIPMPSVRVIGSFAILFLVVLILGAWVNYLVSQLVKKTGLSGTDRMLGTIFGIARGIVIVAILVLVAGLTVLPQDGWWQQSMFMPHFEQLAMAQYMSYICYMPLVLCAAFLLPYFIRPCSLHASVRVRPRAV